MICLHKKFNVRRFFCKICNVRKFLIKMILSIPYLCPQDKQAVMIFVRRPQTDPYFNLAAEEFLLKNSQEDLLMLWQNESSVVVGKHQNVVAEVNLNFVQDNHIPVIRRISGGGTVYHDRGNINLTVIQRAGNQKYPVDFKKFASPVITFLEQFGLEVDFKGKNNLLVNGKKISGNSAHVFKNRVLHHGTLLFNTNLDILEKAIHPRNNNIFDKSIKSIRASVVNIADLLDKPVTKDEFLENLGQFLKNYYSVTTENPLTETEQQAIQKLAGEKYSSWNWNFGYSPKYTLRQEKDTEYGRFQVTMTVIEGRIASVELIFEGKKLEKTEQQLLGQKHDKNELRYILANNRFSDIIIQTLF